MEDTSVNEIDIPKLIKLHRLAVWVAIASFISMCTHIYASLAVLPFQLYCAVRISRAIKLRWWVQVVYVLLMLIPFVSTLAVLSLSNKAGKLLKREGIPIGPMGFKVGKEDTVNYSMELLRAADAKDSNKGAEVLEEELKSRRQD
ncbi:hypothetical protein ACUHMQ_09750 [Chitinimonas sp. PSY-7]|uniref:hypothetical protein n=1 Tax=Chitinimonas sp. PSY-7 TaxID=3459088 RepID=UPI00404002A5